MWLGVQCGLLWASPLAGYTRPSVLRRRSALEGEGTAVLSQEPSLWETRGHSVLGRDEGHSP